MSMVLQLLLTLPVGQCSCEAVELSFSCLRRLKTWSKRGKRICGKKTTFTVLWTNQTLSLCLLCFTTLAAMMAVCENFNLRHFRSTAQRGGHGPSDPMVNTPVRSTTVPRHQAVVVAIVVVVVLLQLQLWTRHHRGPSASVGYNVPCTYVACIPRRGEGGDVPSATTNFWRSGDVSPMTLLFFLS